MIEYFNKGSLFYWFKGGCFPEVDSFDLPNLERSLSFLKMAAC